LLLLARMVFEKLVPSDVTGIHAGEEIRLCGLPTGGLLGESAAIDGKLRWADVVSVTDTLIA
jgi:hypothetical protein